MTNSDQDVPADRSIVTTRVIAAPRDLVWTVWTQPQHLARWFGPTGFTTTTDVHELRVGGQWRFTMHGPDGRDYPNLVTFLEVRAPERLVYRHGGECGVEPVDFTTTVTLDVVAGDPACTRLTIRLVFASPEAREFVDRTYGATEGGRQTLARLAEVAEALAAGSVAAGSVPFRITRVVRAPRELVWRVWTEREHLAQWFGPKGCTLSIEEFDLRPGGRVRYTMHWRGGAMAAQWRIRAVHAPERLEFVTSFTDAEGNTIRAPFADRWPLAMASVVTFEPHAGIGQGTVIMVQTTALGADAGEQKVFDDGHASMTGGWGGTFDQLEAHLAQLGPP